MKYSGFFLVTFITCSAPLVLVEDLPQYSKIAGFVQACNIEPKSNLVNVRYLDPNEKSVLLELIILLAVVSPRPLDNQDYMRYQDCIFDYSGRITSSNDMALRDETVWNIFDRLRLKYQKPENLGLGMCPTIYRAESTLFRGYTHSAPLCVWSILVPCTHFPYKDISDAQSRVLAIVRTYFPEDDKELMKFEWFVSFSGETDESQIDLALFVSLYNALHGSNTYCFVPAGQFTLSKFELYHDAYRNVLSAVENGATLLLPNGEICRTHFCGPRFGFYSQESQKASYLTYPGCKSWSSPEELVHLAAQEPPVSEEKINIIYKERQANIVRAKREAKENLVLNQNIVSVAMPLHVSILVYALACYILIHFYSTIF